MHNRRYQKQLLQKTNMRFFSMPTQKRQQNVYQLNKELNLEYHELLCNRIEHKIEKIIRKNQNGFRRNQSTTSQILTICQILGVRAKNLKQQYYLSTSPKPLTPYAEGRRGKY